MIMSMRDARYRIMTLILSILCACVALYLQIFQFTRMAHICYFCLTAAVLFITTLGLLLYTK
jgi:uncharacterized membrane protein